MEFILKAVPADQFTIEELTNIYNETRSDYIVPMPMNVARLTEYMRVYDVYLPSSCVIVHDKKSVGLGMLGVRPQRAWITRLGVVPQYRKYGGGTDDYGFSAQCRQRTRDSHSLA